MSKRERTMAERGAGAGGEEPQEEHLRSLYAAAYPPAYPSSEPSDELTRRIARLAAQHDTRVARSWRRWLLPLPWGYTAGGLATATLLVAVGLMLAGRHHGHPTGVSRPPLAATPHPSRSAPGSRTPLPAPADDGGPQIADRLSPAPSAGGPSASPKLARTGTGRKQLASRDGHAGPWGAHQRVSPAPVHVPDDMAYLNSDPKDVDRPWTSLPPDEWARIEARVRSRVKVKDDFVTVPFPRLAAASPRLVASAAERYKRQAAIVDARLTQEVTLACKGMAFSDLCDQLRADTGIDLSAGPSAADEKVTIFCEKRPLRDIMREINRVFSFTWLRSGRPGAFKYELEQDLKSQLLEEELRNRDRDATLLALDGEMQKFRPYLNLSFDELEQRAEQNHEVRGLLFNALHNAGWVGMQLYHRLPPAQRAALVAGQTLIFRPGASDPDHRLPAEWQHPILRSWGNMVPIDGKPTPMDEVPGIKVNQVWIKLTRSELGQASLTCGVSAAFGDSLSFTAPMQVGTGLSPAAASPENEKSIAALRSHSPFGQVVSLRPETSCPLLKRGKPGAREQNVYSVSLGNMGQPHVFSGDVWEAVHRVTGLPIVADYYTRMHRLDRVTVEHKTLFEALCMAGDAMGVRWRKDGGFLVARSTRYFWDKLKEVPSRYLRRWAEDRDANGGLPFADFLEMASMPDQELDSEVVAEALEHCWGFPEWSFLHFESFRQGARFLTLLTPEQLQRALQPDGIPFRGLNATQQQGAMRLQLAMNAAGELQTGFPAAVDPSSWANATVYAEYAPAGWYVWEPPVRSFLPRPLFPVTGRTATEAVAAAQHLWAEASADTVKQAEEGHFQVGVRFSSQTAPTE